MPTSINATSKRLRAIDSRSDCPDIDEELIGRFRADLERLWVHGDEGCLGVAVSGGADSLALLLLANAVWPGRVEAASVDHGLRPEAQAECEFVAGICARLNVPHTIITVELATGNLQAEARNARYDALRRWHSKSGKPIFAVATAHHQGDQIETFIMRLNRASGPAGLQSIRQRDLLDPAGPGDAALIRPLLGWRRSELEAIVEAAGIEAVSDPSNFDDRFDRARLRKRLSEADWINQDAWARSIHLLTQSHNLLEEKLSQERLDRMEMSGDGDLQVTFRPNINPLSGSDPAATEHLVWLFQKFGARLARSDAAQLASRLQHGEGGNFAGVMVRVDTRSGQVIWKFEREPPRKSGSAAGSAEGPGTRSDN